MSFSSNHYQYRKIVLAGLLLASTIVLARVLAIRTTILTISFSFAPIMFSAIILGPKYTIFISTIADIIGALVFPVGSYFYGFTITAFLTGLVYGLLLYQKDKFVINSKFVIKALTSILIVVILLNGVLNTIWVTMIVKDASAILIWPRIIKEAVMIPVQIITLSIIIKAFGKQIKEFKNDLRK